MAFQVIQVFLVTTFASGAAATVSAIIDNPSSATTLLAENLPKASNFFISYFIVQGLGIAAGNLLNIGALAMLTVVGKFLDKSPRKMFNRYIKLTGLGWGSLYPKVGNLAIIGASSPPSLSFNLTSSSFHLLYNLPTRPRLRHHRLYSPLPRYPLQHFLRPHQQHQHKGSRLR